MKNDRTLQTLARPLGLLLLGVLTTACSSTTSTFSSRKARVVLAESTGDDGSTVEHRLLRTGGDGIAIHRSETRAVELGDFGVETRSLDGSQAKQWGVEAWRGVLVERPIEGSAAAAAGIRAGDIILSVDGRSMGNREQFEELAVELEPRSSVALELSRINADGSGREEQSLEFEVGVRWTDETSVTRIPLEPVPQLLERAGVQIATVPEDVAREMYGASVGSHALVTGVLLGGPAYLQGVRGGDRVLRCNGLPIAVADDVLELVFQGAEQLDLEVLGPLGEHEASLRLVGDATESTDFDIPILVEHSSSFGGSRTSVLDFIFQFGWNHRTRALASSTREPLSSSYLSILPFGMFEFTRRPGRSTNRIFWFISWGSDS